MAKWFIVLVIFTGAVSTGQAFTDGFETGSLDPAWVAVTGYYPTILTSADSGYILPHSGTYMAYTPQNYGLSWPCVRHSADGGSSGGTATFYVNSSGFNASYIFSMSILSPTGTTIRVMNGGTSGNKVRVNSPSGDNLTSIIITSRTWHEVKFVVSPIWGTKAYWDNTLILANDTAIRAVDKLEFGTNWGCALACYDDISFTPSIADGNVTTLTGTVLPDGYTGDLSDVGIRVELIQGGSVVRSMRTKLDATGKFTFSIVPNDIYDVAIKSYGHLRKVLTGRILTRPATDLGTINLIGGDIEGNNTVTASDLGIVLANMDQVGGL